MITQLKDGTIILNGHEQGIADNPYDGISDMRNINLISIPKEANINYSTIQANYNNTNTINVLSADSSAKTVTLSSNLSANTAVAVVFAGGSLPSGIVAGTTYWLLYLSSGIYYVYTDPMLTTLASITTSGTGTLTVINMGLPKYSTKSLLQGNFIIDGNGRVWFDPLNSGYFRYAGNTINIAYSHGNGIICYEDTINNYSYIFVFRDNSIDYAKLVSNNTITWTYGWRPSDAATGVSGYLNNNTNVSHNGFVSSDNRLNYCDGRYIGRFYQTDPSVAFDPATKSTYTFDNTPLLPATDLATCLSQLGTTILVGGTRNIIYPWDRFSTTYQYPIFLAENYIYNMVTVNTNTFIFAGNRGRIYLTNGTQANLFKKIPDHLTGTVEPYYSWGGAVSIKNQLYFSFSTTTNAGVAVTTCGGIWAIDLNSQALRLTNQLSYGSYSGYASVLTSSVSNTSSGVGLVAGWFDGTSTYGIDIGQSSLYGTGYATIDYDLIPIGTYFEPKTMGTIEFKMSSPTVSNNQIKLQYRQNLTDSFTDIDSTVTFGTGIISGAYSTVPFQNSQWLQIRAVLNGISSTSFGHLTEIRINKQ